MFMGWVRILNVKMSFLTEVIYRFSEITVSILAILSVEINRLFLKLIYRSKELRTTKTILKKKKLEDAHYLILRLTINLH